VGSLTNVSWDVIDGNQMSKDLNLEVVLINDFVAVGYGVLGLNVDDERQVLVLNKGTKKEEKGVIACIGAGTGLGEAFLYWAGDEYVAHGTEGGHTSFSPQTKLEWQLATYIKQRLRLNHISVERLVSGLGIPFIYEFLCKEYPYLISSEVQRKLGLAADKSDHGKVIIEGANSGDLLATRAVELFLDLYGAEVGNFALKTLPYGGVYIAGGIAKRVLPLLKEEDRFLKAFKAKGRMEKVLTPIPIYLILEKDIGLLGAKVKAKLELKKQSGVRSKL